MTNFLWTAGHVDWHVFVFLVFSATCLLVADFIWRTTPISYRKLAFFTVTVWVVGTLGVATSYLS